MKKLVFLFSLTLTLNFSQASHAESNPEMTMTGTISCNPQSHTTEHDHELIFKDSGTGNEYDIVDSPDLLTYHHETNKDLSAEVSGHLTSKFLFWGGNLVVASYKILSEGDAQPLSQPVKRMPSRIDHGGSRR